MNVPSDVRYSQDHEWVRVEEGNRLRIGVTDYAQDALGDVVFIELPTVGTTVEVGGVFGEVESTKSVSELFAPVAGSIVEVNHDLEVTPERVNEDPYGDGWICVLDPTDPTAADSLMDAEAYSALLEA
ncbi:MAG: glycine cleavage system protein GcvH [Acidimicrobiales bacterium]|jgi:glycine cleavage system H protein|nr:glycine cleavage system protein GcvH [Acidimicrobiales bacterium]MDP7117446.1 glycine cleavage system protein GcvH [Acidimicrobiales bacterium]MDP7410499.1 glycine cleavage system protein GcvH [Acidimicrobiales bacterium]MEE1522131.1 glycine cleavage system protein GcvH [Acidimicrobiales bacterium]MEE1571361.1 glycine cleavage system protein GcvH [Acidimicrobiales bacterium]|tara:strand:+ start:1204 stop:1587 length:384 start_codon:yes stop_codon:yes gene_type:complete